jgi:hypothetical protein
MVGPEDFLLHPNAVKVRLDKAYFGSVRNMDQAKDGVDRGRGCASGQ